MTFNQWAAASISNLPTPCRGAFESVWNALTDRGCSTSDIRFLLDDIVESLPEPHICDCEDED